MSLTTLEKIDKYYFLKDIIKSFDEEGLPIDGIDEHITDDELISLVDIYVRYPSLKHFDLIQGVWFRKHAWYLREKNPNIIPLEVVLDWINSAQQVQHHREYAEKYILGRALDKRTVDLNWINGFLKRLAKENDMLK